MPFFNPSLKQINKKEMLRYAGMKEDNPLLEASVSEALREAVIYSEPKGSFMIYDYEQPNLIFDGGLYKFEGDSILSHLESSIKIAVVAATVGVEIEERIEKLFNNGEYSKAVLLDAAATSAVEQTAEALSSFIADKLIKEGLFAGKRFSPGYGDWGIENQQAILSLSLASEIGIEMTSAYMLVPRKSITAVIGFKPFEEKSILASCNECEKDECGYRRIINAKNV